MITRRQFLILTCAATAAPARAQLPTNIVAQRKAALAAALREVTGSAPVRSGRVKLDLPPLVDNGNTVPLSVTVESPMTDTDHVRAIHVFTEKNPQPKIISVTLGPRAGRAYVATRARIADSGDVVAIAQMSDGSFWQENVKVIVTLSACLEEGLI